MTKIAVRRRKHHGDSRPHIATAGLKLQWQGQPEVVKEYRFKAEDALVDTGADTCCLDTEAFCGVVGQTFEDALESLSKEVRGFTAYKGGVRIRRVERFLGGKKREGVLVECLSLVYLDWQVQDLPFLCLGHSYPIIGVEFLRHCFFKWDGIEQKGSLRISEFSRRDG